MKKKSFIIAAVVLSLTMFFAVGTAACGDTENDGGTEAAFIYTLSDDGFAYTVSGITVKTVSEIIVPDEYRGKPVTEIADEAFKDCSSATRIVIPNSVKTIGRSALRGCGALTSLSIPFSGRQLNAKAERGVFGYVFGQAEYSGGIDTVQQFGEAEEDNETFYLPAALREVAITGTEISFGAFSNCTFIDRIVIGSLVSSIGDKAFLNNNLAYVYVESKLVASNLLGPRACGGLLSNIPAVCIAADVTDVSGYVAGMDTKSAWEYKGKNYEIYANRKNYRFEAENSQFGGGLASVECAVGANGVVTGGGSYLGGFYPNGGTGQCYMEFNINSSKDAKVKFYYCCGSRSTHFFNSCYKLTLNGTVVVPENNVDLSLPTGVSFQWTQWTRYEIMEFDLKAGDNVFRMQFTPDGKETATAFSNDMYVDYIEFETDAILTWVA